MKTVKNLCGFAVPLGALRTESSPVIGEYSSIVQAAEFAKKCGLSIIQLLPVLDSGTQSSPYSSLSAFALHPIYIKISDIPGFDVCMEKNKGFRQEYENFLKHKNDTRFDYEFVLAAKERLIRSIWRMIVHSGCMFDLVEGLRDHEKKFLKFISETEWLPDYCVFKSLKNTYMQASSRTWDKSDRNLSNEQILARWNDDKLKEEQYFYAFEQLVAYEQFKAASDKVRELGIILKGDLPILLNEDSCDVWANREIFNDKLRAGSPPDGDNPTGQNWGFPVYNWAAQEKDDFKWWKLRLSECEKYFSAYRLDHIPGFFRIWAMHSGEKTAEFGGVVPHACITKASLLNAGFTKERVKWLSEPHIPTEDIFRLTGNLEQAHDLLEVFCTRIGREELWNFKPTIKSSSDISEMDISEFGLDEEIQREVTESLLNWWKNRTLIEVEKNKFIPYYKFGETKAWNSLNNDERSSVSALLIAMNKKQEKLWKTQAEKIFSQLIPHTNMTPCGEDLGVNIECMPKTMEKFGILGLKVIRWCRDWFSDGQPFEEFKKYKKLSLVTTSVHDSSTLRQWWNSEKMNAKAFEKAFLLEKDEETGELSEPILYEYNFDSQIAQKVLSACAETNGAWFVNPIQDWLYLDDSRKSKCWRENQDEERVNIPGTVSEFNWTYRLPVSIEKLCENSELLEKILKIVEIHDKSN